MKKTLSLNVESMLLLALFAVFQAGTASAWADVAITNTLSSVSTDGELEPDYAEYLIRISDPTTPPNFAFDFGAPGSHEVSFTWAAPAGQLFEFAVPTTFNGERAMNFRTLIGNSGSSSDPDFTATLSVQGSVGDPVPTGFGFITLPNSGNAINAIMNIEGVPGETYRFASVTATATIPDTYTRNLNSAFFFSQVQSLVTHSGEPVPDDPGAFFRLVTVPEPGSLALLALGAGVVARRRAGRGRVRIDH